MDNELFVIDIVLGDKLAAIEIFGSFDSIVASRLSANTCPRLRVFVRHDKSQESSKMHGQVAVDSDKGMKHS